jgi:hypothetical protein
VRAELSLLLQGENALAGFSLEVSLEMKLENALPNHAC